MVAPRRRRLVDHLRLGELRLDKGKTTRISDIFGRFYAVKLESGENGLTRNSDPNLRAPVPEIAWTVALSFSVIVEELAPRASLKMVIHLL